MNTPTVAARSASEPTLVRGLSLLDTVLLLVGGVIGSGIFLTAGGIAAEVHRADLFLLVWIVGGAISLLACFAFAELAAMFPQAGGQYVFLREAYGEFPAFLYGWMIFSVGQTGTIAAIAAAFAEYSGYVFPALDSRAAIFTVAGWPFTRGSAIAIAAIALLTAINAVGLRRGAIVQNVATWAKFAAMGAFVLLGLTIGKGTWGNFSTAVATPGTAHLLSGFGVALIAVFWAYDGWVYATWVAGEVKEPQRNLPRALVLGILLIGVVYVSINAVYVYSMPMTNVAESQTTIAMTSATRLFSPGAAVWLALAIAVSCFGALNSAILSSARVAYAMARDGAFFHAMGRVHPRWRTPAFSLVAQGVWASVLALSGRYDQLFTYAVFMMVLSYMAGVAALFVLRRTRPDQSRPYRCVGYPWVPAIYLIVAAIWGANAVVRQPKETLIGIGIVLLGVPGYLYWRRQRLGTAEETE